MLLNFVFSNGQTFLIVDLEFTPEYIIVKTVHVLVRLLWLLRQVV